MSHIVTIQSRLRDAVAIAAACQRLNLPAPAQGQARMFGGQAVEGLLVQLPGWKYPIAIDTASGQVQHDNYGGAWGDIEKLHAFQQAYAIELVRIESRKKGYTVSEQLLADGSVKLNILEGS